ncbi:MAG: hypothetical protein IJH76_05195 [Clostridia bacterium]|nr:hypothetical protein [Clostridia bacterium]
MKKISVIFGIILLTLLFVIVFLVVKNNEDKKSIANNNLLNGKSLNEVNENNQIENETENYTITESISNQENKIEENQKKEGSLSSIEDINLHDIDGKETNYIFTYNNRDFSAIYIKDNWRIIDSYLITNTQDMKIICEALITIHPIHGRDRISYRTIQDLVKEWELHNLAYAFLSEDSKWKSNAKDVDLNPEDQGKSLEDFYKSRINE